MPKKECLACKGRGRISGEREIQVSVLPGVQNGQIIKIKGAGEAGEYASGEGDLYARINIVPHKTFEREGDDLFVQKELNIFDLLLGRKIEVPTVRGGKIEVEVPSSFNFKDNLKVPGEGMPRFGAFGRGNMHISITFKFPKKVSAKAKKLLEDLEKEV